MTEATDTRGDETRPAPRTLIGSLGAIGPGIMVIGSVMGSGELINTPIQAAKFGFVLLWAVILTSVIKYFLQIEIGRHTLAHNRTPLESFNSLPFPKFLGTSWIGILFVATSLPTSLAFAGMLGMTAGLMHSLVPLSGEDQVSVQIVEADGVARTETLIVGRTVRAVDGIVSGTGTAGGTITVMSSDGAALSSAVTVSDNGRWKVEGVDADLDPNTKRSAQIWVVVLAAVVIGILWRGIYEEMEKLITFLVIGFSVSVVVSVFLIQGTPYAITADQVVSGVTFSLGEHRQLAGFAVISLMGALGATANEMFMYPYWVLEKGYVKYTGTMDSEGWAERTRGWIRIMQIDVGVCTVLATVITAAYFLIGAAVLHGQSIVPEGRETVDELSSIFTASYGAWSRNLFLFGAFCTLFSTMIVGVAAFGRMWGDLLMSMGFLPAGDTAKLKRCHHVIEGLYFVVLVPVAMLAARPEKIIILTGWFSGIVCTPLVIFGITWLAFRTDKRVRMGKFSAICLILSVAVILGCLLASQF